MQRLQRNIKVFKQAYSVIFLPRTLHWVFVSFFSKHTYIFDSNSSGGPASFTGLVRYYCWYFLLFVSIIPQTLQQITIYLVPLEKIGLYWFSLLHITLLIMLIALFSITVVLVMRGWRASYLSWIVYLSWVVSFNQYYLVCCFVWVIGWVELIIIR